MDALYSFRNSILLKLRKYLGVSMSTLWRNPVVKKTFIPYIYEPRNAELKNIYKGKRAFIIGNGPSILKQDLTRLNGEITFVLNDFFLHPQYHEINPTYLCSCDPGFTDIEFRKAWYGLHQKVDTSKTIMLFKKSAERIDKKYDLFHTHTVYYLRAASMLVAPLWELKYCPTDITMPLSGHNLTFIDIGLLSAYYMGIKKIYLLGMDWAPITSLKQYINYNFYGKHPLIPLIQYRKDYNFYYKNKAYQDSRIGYHGKTIACLKRTFAKKGMNIYNATYHKSYFEGFRHVDFEKVIKKEE